MIRRRVRLVAAVFPGAQILDVAGPVAVFSAANRHLPRNRGYDVALASDVAGPLRTNSPIELLVSRSWSQVGVENLDVLLVAGGMPGTDAAASSRALRGLVRNACRQGKRVAAVCTGALILAAAGLLDGRRCTTHWQYIERLRREHPAARVVEDALFVEDGGVWTSAGVTAGMDMALAMVADDFGSEVSARVAQDLVMFAVRPGSQRQISDTLDLPPTRNRKFRDLILWVRANPAAKVDVSTLAERCAMTPRTFTRRFREECGVTPAKMVEEARVARAKTYLESTDLPLSRVATLSGFPSRAAMDAAFARRLGLTPGGYRAGAATPAHDRPEPVLSDVPARAPQG